MEWVNAPESNRLANGRCRNPNDPTTTVECEQQPPPTARRAVHPQQESSPHQPPSDNSEETGRAEVLSKLRVGLEPDAARLFWDLPQGARTSAFAAEVTRVRVEHAKSLESKPRDVAGALRSLKLDKLPGDKETLEALAERVAKALRGLAKYGASESGDFRLGAFLVQAVHDHPAEMGETTTEALKAFEAKYGPLLVAADIKDEEDWEAFIKLFPDSSYSEQMNQHIAELQQLAVASDVARRREQEADRLWLAVQGYGDEMATYAYKISFAERNFAPHPRTLRGIAGMRSYRAGLARDSYCPAKKEFVDVVGAGEFQKRAAAHCKDEAPTDVGVGGVQIVLTNECRAAFAVGC
jgi:hypothetical protein